MARQRRIEYEGALYSVMLRNNEREILSPNFTSLI